ncbi:MAG: hypothetical protein ABI823_10565 [Bryobacteraceae bacterium]
MIVRWIALLSLMLVPAFAESVAGTWIPARANPNQRPPKLVLIVDGGKVTGSFTNGSGKLPLSGTVDGNNISFILEAAKDGRASRFKYEGGLSGDELKLTIQREGSDTPPRPITMKREQTASK